MESLKTSDPQAQVSCRPDPRPLPREGLSVCRPKSYTEEYRPRVFLSSLVTAEKEKSILE